jgi:adenylate cyclase
MAPVDPGQHAHQAEEIWRTYMLTGQMPEALGAPWFMKRFMRPVARWLPSDPRCRICDYPFTGLGGWLSHTLFGLAPSKMNPQLCNVCEASARYFRGGAEVEMSLLFVDVRGSTTIAENKSPLEFSRLIERFYKATSRVLYQKNALIEKLIGDEVTGFFVPGIAGPEHARAAIEAGEEILRVTGHGDPHGPWVPVGVGVHTGLAYVGAVGGTDSAPDISVLGDTVNTAARIASQAGVGELLVSAACGQAAHIQTAGLETRHLSLKGRSEPIDVWVKRIKQPLQSHVGK